MQNSMLADLIESMNLVNDPLKAPKMAKYMKDHFEYLGVSSPERKLVVSEFYKTYKSELKHCWREFTLVLWKQNHREFQYVAMDLMQKFKKGLLEEDLEFIHHLITTKSWWDTVDFIAAHMAGMYFELFPKKRSVIKKEWMRSKDLWLNRTAIIFQLKYKQKTDFDLLKLNILHHQDSKEFFINKASGWALRQHSKYDKVAVRSFIKEHPELSNLTKREGSKYL